MIEIVDATPAHARWIESSLRKSQRESSFVARVMAQHLFSARVRVARVGDNDIGWIAHAGRTVVYLYVRWSVRRQGVATDLLADAAAHVGSLDLVAATWTRAADYLGNLLRYDHAARAAIEVVALRKNPREDERVSSPSFLPASASASDLPSYRPLPAVGQVRLPALDQIRPART